MHKMHLDFKKDVYDKSDLERRDRKCHLFNKKYFGIHK